MLIETYEIEPETTSDGVVETDEAAVALIEELELQGQQALVKKDEDTGDVKRVPYLEMTKQEKAVYQACYPRAESVQEYSAGLIPLRVLQVIAHARQLFDKVLIWHDREIKDPDPILVGRIGGDYDGRHFLLARWGEALVPFAEILERAQTRLRERYRKLCAAKRSEVDLFEVHIEAHVDKKLDGGHVSEP